MTKPIQPVGSTVQKPEAVGGPVIHGGTLIDLPHDSGLLTQGGTFRWAGPSGDGLRPATRRLGSAGLRSTEFWLCAACAALGAVLCFTWPLPEALAGALLVGLAASSYAYCRGKVKGRPYGVQGKL